MNASTDLYNVWGHHLHPALSSKLDFRYLVPGPAAQVESASNFDDTIKAMYVTLDLIHLRNRLKLLTISDLDK